MLINKEDTERKEKHDRTERVHISILLQTVLK